MFRNLDAEQSRYGLSNADVADKLGIHRNTYENKKKEGGFTRLEIITLLKLFDCKFEYLFQTKDDTN